MDTRMDYMSVEADSAEGLQEEIIKAIKSGWVICGRAELFTYDQGHYSTFKWKQPMRKLVKEFRP